MDKLSAMKTYVQIVEKGSLTAAAEALNKSLPSVVRTLAALEKSLNVQLLYRTTRRIAVTEEGRFYLEQCRRILVDIEETEQELSAQQHEPNGALHVTAPVLFGSMYVAPAVTAFLKQYKHVSVDLLLLDRVVNLVEEGMDVAIRIGHPPDSTMVARSVGQIRRVLCASPNYLSKKGIPARPEEISSHKCVRFTSLDANTTWKFFDEGKPLKVQVSGAFGCNQATAAIDACVEGLGMGLFLSYQVAPLLKQGKLELLLTEFEPPPFPVCVVYSHTKRLSARTRVFVDWMATTLRSSLNM